MSTCQGVMPSVDKYLANVADNMRDKQSKQELNRMCRRYLETKEQTRSLSFKSKSRNEVPTRRVNKIY